MIDHIKFICTTFDPGAGRYRIDYGLMFGSVIGAFSLIVFGAILLREWRRAGGGSAKSTLHLSLLRRGRIPSAREESG
jgi:hypothetical protein